MVQMAQCEEWDNYLQVRAALAQLRAIEDIPEDVSLRLESFDEEDKLAELQKESEKANASKWY